MYIYEKLNITNKFNKKYNILLYTDFNNHVLMLYFLLILLDAHKP